MNPSLHVAYVGNFEPPHSTENHIASALEANGHTVARIQENHPWSYFNAAGMIHEANLILWTRTGWDWAHIFKDARGETTAFEAQRRMLRLARQFKVPVVGYHLDLWFGLNREHQLDEPFFQSDIVITADGGHQAEFAERGINHVWFPPGVSRAECELGMFRDEFHSKLAFVGSWQGHYHQEHQHRFELVEWLRKNFRRDCNFWPKEGQPAVRGKDLRDLYASIDIAVGDSCFAGTGPGWYWSDRIPETVGRGAFLLHPYVPGIEQHFTPGGHFGCWNAGQWDSLGNMIEFALAHPDWRQGVAAAGRSWVMREHTYERRMEQLVDLLHERNLL